MQNVLKSVNCRQICYLYQLCQQHAKALEIKNPDYILCPSLPAPAAMKHLPSDCCFLKNDAYHSSSLVNLRKGVLNMHAKASVLE